MNNQNNPKPFIIYSRKLAGYLLSQNCKLLKVRPNINDQFKDVYIFENTNKLIELIEDYKLQKTIKEG